MILITQETELVEQTSKGKIKVKNLLHYETELSNGDENGRRRD